MSTTTTTKVKKSAKAAYVRGRDTVTRAGKVAKSTVVVAAKAGTAAAIAAGTVEAKKGWKQTSPQAAKKRTRTKIAAVLGGAALLGVAGMAVARSRRKK